MKKYFGYYHEHLFMKLCCNFCINIKYNSSLYVTASSKSEVCK